MRPVRKHTSIADLFCDTYIVSEGCCSYIMLPSLLIDASRGGQLAYILQPNAREQCLTEFEGVPAYRIRNRFAKSIRRKKNNVKAIFADLNLVFTDNAIKQCFTLPNIWLLNNNVQARIRRAKEVNIENRMRKIDPAGYALHKQVENRMSNKSVRQCTREEREMQ